MEKSRETIGTPAETIDNPELAETIAYSTKVLRDAAAKLREKAQKRGHEKMAIGNMYVSYQYVVDAFRKKAEVLDLLADSLEKDAIATSKLIEQETDSLKKQLLLKYELFKANFISKLYASFHAVDELTPKDLNYRRLQEEAAASLAAQERRRQEKIKPSIPRPPKFILRAMGFSEEEIERWP